MTRFLIFICFNSSLFLRHLRRKRNQLLNYNCDVIIVVFSLFFWMDMNLSLKISDPQSHCNRNTVLSRGWNPCEVWLQTHDTLLSCHEVCSQNCWREMKITFAWSRTVLYGYFYSTNNPYKLLYHGDKLICKLSVMLLLTYLIVLWNRQKKAGMWVGFVSAVGWKAVLSGKFRERWAEQNRALPAVWKD